jgi:SAM-dependent methyltransferase
MIVCPLCFNEEFFLPVKGPDNRIFKMCRNCELIFAENRYLLTETEEKQRYLHHNNGIHNEGYVKFLNQAIEPALPLISRDMKGLDFGCGPTPTLSVLLTQKGFGCDDFDPFFFPHIPQKQYDFIFATECFEHFYHPAKEIAHIHDLLKPGGILIIMTEIWKSPESFEKWYYAKDPTHVMFFNENTFRFMTDTYGFKHMKNDGIRVFMFKKR